MLRSAGFGVALVTALIATVDAEATDREALAVEGTYFLIQDDGFQRVLSFDRGGNISQISDQETLIGFTTSTGAWARTDPEKAVATMISFNYDVYGSDTVGATAIRYEFTFSDMVDGKYQAISGSYAGKTYAEGQNPLRPSEAPVRTFGTAFAGSRVNAD
ncbi:MAG: hypothetical protein GY798_17790 [Hyphomicrobiales bacterium]|nr:hypothetical protein [Hyphomicrobiales bacterium]